MDTPLRDSEEHHSSVLSHKPQSFAQAEWEVIDTSEQQTERFQTLQFEVVNASVNDVDPNHTGFSQDEFCEDPLVAPYKRVETFDDQGNENWVQDGMDCSIREGVSQEVGPMVSESLVDEEEQVPSGVEATPIPSITEQSDDQEQDSLSSEPSVIDATEEHEPTQAVSHIEKPENEEAVTEMDVAMASDVSQVGDMIEATHEEDSAVSDSESEEMTLEPDPLEDAFEAGYQKGLEESREEVQHTQQQLAEQYTLLWEDMQVQLDEMKAEHERKAVDLAMHVARKLVGEVVGEHPTYIVEVIQEALESISNATIKLVRVSPQSYELLSLGEYGERIKIHGDQKLSFKADDSIRAGCIVETSAGETDFDLEKTWTRIYEKVAGGAKS